MTFTPLNRTPAYMQIAEQIRAAIERGDLVAGTPLPTEHQMAKQFGVSRTTIREALRRLQAQGAVQAGGSAPYRTIVRPSSSPLEQALGALIDEQQASSDDLIDLRSCLEVGAIYRGCLGRPRWDATAQALERIRDVATTTAEDGAVAAEELHAAFLAYHESIVEASGNELMATTIGAIHLALVEEIRTAIEALSADADGGGLQRFVEEHARILAALEAGDTVAAQELVRALELRFFMHELTGGAPTAERRDPPPPRSRSRRG